MCIRDRYTFFLLVFSEGAWYNPLIPSCGFSGFILKRFGRLVEYGAFFYPGFVGLRPYSTISDPLVKCGDLHAVLINEPVSYTHL